MSDSPLILGRRQIQAILNKLTPQNFDKLAQEIIDSPLPIEEIVPLIVTKALEASKFIAVYAQLCHRLSVHHQPYFRSLLVTECQRQFANKEQRVHGLIKLIGELTKLKLISSKIVRYCLSYLLRQPTDGTNVECVCQLLTSLQSDEFNCYVSIIQAVGSQLPSRLKFMVQDLVDCRHNDWKPRQVVLQPQMLS